MTRRLHRKILPLPEDAVSVLSGQQPFGGSMDQQNSTRADHSYLARQSVEEIRLPGRLIGYDSLFLLRMHGSSMVDAEINDGDWAVIRQRSFAESGEIVAAIIDQEVTIKRFKRVNKQIWLMPENLANIPVPGNEAVILGQVVALLRRFLLVYS
jgi:SOS regulatory protein LexA